MRYTDERNGSVDLLTHTLSTVNRPKVWGEGWDYREIALLRLSGGRLQQIGHVQEATVGP